MTMTLGDLTELATWVLGFGETAVVVEPPELVARVTRELQGALSRYGKGAKPPAVPEAVDLKEV
jgi:predicted DNA-binding transcriptional regulator YafY